MTFKRRTFSRDQSGIFDTDDDTGSRRRTRLTLRRSVKSRSKRPLWAKGVCIAVGLYVAWCAAAGAGASSWLWENELTISLGSKIGVMTRRLETVMKKTPDSRFSLEYLMGMNSAWRNRMGRRGSNVADVTAILLDSPSLEKQLVALLESSTRVQEVWVILPGEDSPGIEVVERYRKHAGLAGRLHGIRSDLFFSGGDAEFYSEGLVRYQLALQAKTNYIWILDPEVMPGRRFLSLLAHVSTSREVRGMLGGAGGLLPASASQFWSDSSDLEVADTPVLWNASTLAAITDATPGMGEDGRSDEAAAAAIAAAIAAAAGTAAVEVGGVNPAHTAPVLWPVDVLHSQWFLPRNLIHVLFREKWPAHMYSEALALSYSLRRYAGLESYVLPFESKFPEYAADVADASGMNLSSTTGGAQDKEGVLNRAKGLRPRRSSQRKPFRSQRDTQHRLGTKDLGRKASKGVRRKLSTEREPSSAEREWSRTKPKDLASALRYPGFKSQYRDLSAQGGRWFWTPAQCPKELMLIVVHGRDQAELLGPLYRELVQAAESGARRRGNKERGDHGRDVFVALIADGDDGRGPPASPVATTTATPSTEALSLSRTARPECREIARALGVSSQRVGRLRRSGEHGASGDDRSSAMSLDRLYARSMTMLGTSPDDVGSSRGRAAIDARGQKNRVLRAGIRGWGWLSGYSERWRRLEMAMMEAELTESARDGEAWGSHHSLSPEEFCLGDAFGVFHIRVGQDYTRAPDQRLHRFLDVFHGLSELLGVVEPTALAYIESVQQQAEGETGGTNDVVAAAVEAATRSSGANQPLGIRLPATVDGAAAAKALAYLPEGCLQQWKEPSVVVVLVHLRSSSATSLRETTLSLRQTHFLGDSVELRILLHESHIGDVEVDRIIRDSPWTNGQSDLSYFSDEGADSASLSAALAALEAFSAPDVHSYVIPLTSGTRPSTRFFSWLKVALVGERYVPEPHEGPSVADVSKPADNRRMMRIDGRGMMSSRETNRRLQGGVFPDRDEEDRTTVVKAAAGDEAGEASFPDHNLNGSSRGSRGERPLGTLHDDEIGDNAMNDDDGDDGDGDNDDQGVVEEEGSAIRREDFFVLSVPSDEGMCSAVDKECSRVWMYNGLAWNALRERCRRALAEAVLDRGAGSSVEAACAVGDDALVQRSGLSPKHVCATGPADDAWQRATVWETRSLSSS